jgi:hypothetical protein
MRVPLALTAKPLDVPPRLPAALGMLSTPCMQLIALCIHTVGVCCQGRLGPWCLYHPLALLASLRASQLHDDLGEGTACPLEAFLALIADAARLRARLTATFTATPAPTTTTTTTTAPPPPSPPVEAQPPPPSATRARPPRGGRGAKAARLGPHDSEPLPSRATLVVSRATVAAARAQAASAGRPLGAAAAERPPAALRELPWTAALQPRSAGEVLGNEAAVWLHTWLPMRSFVIMIADECLVRCHGLCMRRRRGSGQRSRGVWLRVLGGCCGVSGGLRRLWRVCACQHSAPVPCPYGRCWSCAPGWPRGGSSSTAAAGGPGTAAPSVRAAPSCHALGHPPNTTIGTPDIADIDIATYICT